MIKKVLPIALLLLLAIVVYTKVDRNQAGIDSFEKCVEMGNPVGESHPRQCWTKDGKHFVEELSNRPEVDITINGEITCLPKKGNGPHTMECAIGLLADDGKYYSLINLSEVDPDYKFSEGGLRVTVHGTLTPESKTGPDGNRYNTDGSINVKNITQN